MTVLAFPNQENSAHLTLTDGVASPSACLATLGARWNEKSDCPLVKGEPKGEYSECGNRKKKDKTGLVS